MGIKILLSSILLFVVTITYAAGWALYKREIMKTGSRFDAPDHVHATVGSGAILSGVGAFVGSFIAIWQL